MIQSLLQQRTSRILLQTSSRLQSEHFIACKILAFSVEWLLMLRSHLRSGKAHGAILWSPKTLEWASYILVSQEKKTRVTPKESLRVG